MVLPPESTGGNTEFADSRSAWEDLPDELRDDLLREDYVGAFSHAHSRKLGSPEFFKHVDPYTAAPMARHKIVQVHEPSGRMNLYIGAHLHHLESPDGKGGLQEIHPDKSKNLIDTLYKHATQDKYVVSIQWKQPGDVIIWDNRAVLHRAGEWSGEGEYVRDLRRTTVHDDGVNAWGLNPVSTASPSVLVGMAERPGLSLLSGAPATVREGVKV